VTPLDPIRGDVEAPVSPSHVRERASRPYRRVPQAGARTVGRVVNHVLADVVAPVDALLLKGDADPATRAIMTSALVLDGAPDIDRLTAAFQRASDAVPRMHQRVVRPWSHGRARWVTDDSFDVRAHVHRSGAPGDCSLAAVLSMASDSATVPFDPARPLWDATLVTGVADGRAVVLLRVHHAIADGVRALHMMASLLDLEPEPAGSRAVTLEQRGSRLQAVRDQLLKRTSEAVTAQQRRADSLAGTMIDLTWRPLEAAAGAASYLRSALRTYTDVPATPSPVLGERSRSRVFAILELPLSDMREVAKANSATINDVFLTGLLGGIRRYHESRGEPVQDVPIAIPIDLARDTDSPTSGNHFSAAVIAGPCEVEDPRARLRVVHELVASRRAEAGVDVPLRLAPLLHQTPSWIADKALKAYSRRIDLQASNIVGPDCPVYLAGTKVERFYAFGPLPGIPVMAVMVSYDGTATIGLTIDPAAVTDPEVFVACTEASLSELSRCR
jgi:diacylglycerol O-acyltransferase